MNVTIKLIDPVGAITAPFKVAKKAWGLGTRGRQLLKYSDEELEWLLNAALFL